MTGRQLQTFCDGIYIRTFVNVWLQYLSLTVKENIEMKSARRKKSHWETCNAVLLRRGGLWYKTLPCWGKLRGCM